MSHWQKPNNGQWNINKQGQDWTIIYKTKENFKLAKDLRELAHWGSRVFVTLERMILNGVPYVYTDCVLLISNSVNT